MRREDWLHSVAEKTLLNYRLHRPTWLNTKTIAIIGLDVNPKILEATATETDTALKTLGLDYQLKTYDHHRLAEAFPNGKSVDGDAMLEQVMSEMAYKVGPRIILTPHEEVTSNAFERQSYGLSNINEGILIFPVGEAYEEQRMEGFTRTILWHELGHMPGWILEHHNSFQGAPLTIDGENPNTPCVMRTGYKESQSYCPRDIAGSKRAWSTLRTAQSLFER